MSRIFKHAYGCEHTPFVMETLGAKDIFSMGQDGRGDDKVGTNSEAIEKEAYEKGFTAGERAGFELGRQKAEVLFSGLGGIIKELESFKQRLYEPCVEEMKELALAVARKVIHRELALKEDTVLSCVENALKSVVAGGDITIWVNPRDLELLRKHKPEIIKSAEGVKSASIEADEAITKGGCVVETRHGEIDATIDSVIEEIEARLRDAH